MRKIKQFISATVSHYRPLANVGMVMLALLVASQLLMLSIPYFEGRIFDKLAERAPFNEAAVFVFWILAVYLANTAVNFARERYEVRNFDFVLPEIVGTTTLERLFRFSLGQHVNENSGLRLSVINKGTQALTQLMNNFIYTILPFTLQVVLAVGALLIISAPLGLIVLAISVSYLFLQFRYNVVFYPHLKKNRDAWNKQSKYNSEILRNVKLVKLSAKEDVMVSEYRQYFRKVADQTRGLWSEFITRFYLHNLLMHFGRAAALLAGVYLVTAGVESPGRIVMLIGWMASVFGNVGYIGMIQRQMITQIGDINKYHEMLEREPAVMEATHPHVLPRLKGRIEFRNVSFAYPKIASIEDGDENDNGSEKEEITKEIISNVSFVIEPGETVALVGRSGAGKTTVVNLLLRGYDPDNGEIFVDGVLLKELDQRRYLRAVGYVPQVVEMFDNTLRYNMTFSAPRPETVADEELETMARKARIDQFYDRLGEKKFETIIGENGIKLSGGERQRVGIARALLKRPEILIFDEATSSLDAENEAIIHEAMREALEGRTGIIIAHRLSTIRDADKIIVMDGGRIAGIGRHDELIQTCEPYRKLIARQVVAL